MYSISMGRIIGLSNKIRLISLSTNQLRNISFTTPNIIKKVCEDCGLPEAPVKYSSTYQYFCVQQYVKKELKGPNGYRDDIIKKSILWHATSDAEKEIWGDKYNEECKIFDMKMEEYLENLSEESITIFRHRLMKEFRLNFNYTEKHFLSRSVVAEKVPQLLDRYNYYKTFVLKNREKITGSKINNWEEYENLTEKENNELRTNYAAYKKKIINEYAAWQDRIISEGKQYLFRVRMKKTITL